MTNRFATAALGLAALLALSATAEAATKLLVYTALEADQLKAYEEAFEAANPDIDDQLGARLDRHRHRQAPGREGQSAGRRRDGPGGYLADAPPEGGHADAIRARGLADIKPLMRDPADPPKWVGMDVWSSALCFNTVEAEQEEARRSRRAGTT